MFKPVLSYVKPAIVLVENLLESLMGVRLIKLLALYLEERRKHVYREEITYSTYGVYVSKVRVITAYLHHIGKPNLKASEADNKFGEALIDHFLANFKSKDYTNYLVEVIRAALDLGVREQLIKVNNMASLVLKFKNVPKNVKLTKEQLELLITFPFKKERHNFYRELFLLQCLEGVAHSDIDKLVPENIVLQKIVDEDGNETDGEFFKFNRKKTGSEVYVRVHRAAREILEKHNWQMKRVRTQVYNYNLHQISALLNLPVRLTSHVGRHTYAQLFLNEKHSTEALMITMGHKTHKSSLVYARPGLDRLVREINDLQKEKLAKKKDPIALLGKEHHN